MGRRVEVDLFFSEWEVIQALKINIVEVCRKGIKNEIRDRAETREIVKKQRNVEIENENLRSELARLRKRFPTLDDHNFWGINKKPID